MNWSWMLPASASTFGPDIDQLYYVILWITGVVFVVTEALLLWFAWKYRHREGRSADYIHGNMTAEVVWTVIPFLIVVGIALGSKGVWADVRNPENIPEDAMDIRLVASQFEWNATYAGADGVFETDDDYTLRNRMTIPANQAIRVMLEADDVLHSFFLPDMRVKQDAVPGMVIPVWFESTRAGEFPIGCAELCGIGHTTMGGTLTVLPTNEFRAWQAEQQAAAQPQ